MELTDQQKQIVAHAIGDHGVVRAGPGTGKSATIVALAQRLATEGDPTKLRFLTFTRAATSELGRKILAIEGLGIKPSTVHSFALSILLRNKDALAVHLPLRIPSDAESGETIYPYISKLSGISKTRVDRLIRWMAAMWQSLEPDETTDFTASEKAQFTAAFKASVHVLGFTLLDQLPDLLRHLLIEHEDVSGLGMEMVIVDEYQDLNKCEIELLKLLAGRGAHILAVGDEDQSIYSNRKAHPLGIRTFEHGHAGAVSYDLSICHRCPTNILGWAQHVIAHDLGRSERPLPDGQSDRQATTRLLHFTDEKKEAKGVARLIDVLVRKDGFASRDILVLTRTDWHERFTKPIKAELLARNIGTFDARTAMELLREADTQRLLALLQLLENREDSLAWATLLNTEAGIGDTTKYKLFDQAREAHTTFAKVLLSEEMVPLSRATRNKLRGLIARVDGARLKRNELATTENVRWGQWIIDHAATIVGIAPSSALSALLVSIDQRLADTDPELGMFLSQIAPTAKDIANEQQDGVRFMTMQSAKGLTARATFVVGVDDDLIPSPRNKDRNEEARLLYVAMTRSEDTLIMTWANRRAGAQARSGRPNVQRRTYSELLQHGPVETESGEKYVSHREA